MTTAATDRALSDRTERPRPYQAFAKGHPLAAFLLLVFGIGFPLLAVPAIAGISTQPFLLVLVYVVLLAPALIVTRVAEGPGAIRRLLSRVLIWRFSPARWGVILFAVPLLTVAVAAVSGTLDGPEGSWLGVVGTYLFLTLIFGAQFLNLWEETAWGGFAQSRLMADHGLLVGSLLTAPWFAAIHIPLLFDSGWTWSEVGLGFAVLAVATPFYRYLLGMHLLDTRGSILAIGIQHAAWNASGNIDGVDGTWQAAVAVAVLTVLLAIGRRLWRPEARPMGRDDEKAAAAEWMFGR